MDEHRTNVVNTMSQMKCIFAILEHGLQTTLCISDNPTTKRNHSTCNLLLLCRSIGFVLAKSSSLLENPVLSSLAGSLALETASLHLILKKFAALRSVS
jgi:hypothetical protein